jgi:ubiquinone/menaquinone biosynthesis C-methylase UbiE
MTPCPEILRCPRSFEPLQPMGTGIPTDQLAEIYYLSNKSQTFAYPVVNDIVMLLKESAVSLGGMKAAMSATESDEKSMVRNFYDAVGWKANAAGDYTDASIYEDLRPVSAGYIRQCHQRVGRHLPLAGKFLLDAASGAVQFKELVDYSKNFRYRVCVDFSLSALQEAQKKLGTNGIYVLCDITNLPFQDSFADAFVSLNTIYHIPQEQQAKAIWELYRTLKPSGKGVLVYDWFKHSVWMNIFLLPFRAFSFLKNRISGTKGAGGRLYFFAHPLSWFRQNLPPFQLLVWRSVSVPFLRFYIHDWLFGQAILRKIYAYEEKHPDRCGRLGEYPMMIFEKASS